MVDLEKGEIHDTSIIGDNVKIGRNVKIHPYVVIDGNVVIEDNVEIMPYCYIGGAPEHKTLPANEDGHVFIGAGAKIFQNCAITMPTLEMTYIGKNAFVMGYSHIGHDAKVMDNAIIGGKGMLAGHSIIGENAFLGDSSVVHQWSVVGAYCMVGMGTPVRHNSIPYSIIYGSPARWARVNMIGIERSDLPLNSHWAIHEILDRLTLEKNIMVGDLELMISNYKDDINLKPIIDHFDSFINRVKMNQNYNASNKGALTKYGGGNYV